MIAIAVVASLVVYAWVSGYMGFQTDKAGKAIYLPSFTGVASQADPDVGDLIVYVQNVGQGTVEVSAVYVDDELRNDWNAVPSAVIAEGNTAEVTITGPFDLTVKHDIKVTTTDGTFMTTTGKPLKGSVSAPVTPFAIVSSFTITDPAESIDYSVAAGSSFTVKAMIHVSAGSVSVSATPTFPTGYTGSATVSHTVGTSDVEFAWTVTAPSYASASAAVTLAASATGYTSDTDNTFNVATDVPSVATKLVFTVHPSTIAAGVNTLFTIERQTASGNPTTEGGAITITLDDKDVANANFYVHEGDTYPNVIYSITLPAGSSSVNVYYGYWVQNPLPADLHFTATYAGLTPATADVHVVAP